MIAMGIAMLLLWWNPAMWNAYVSLITVSGFLFMGALRRLMQDKKMDALIKVITEERNEFHEWARETANETAAREERFHEWARETANETAAREERFSRVGT